jgi:site-specific DNA-methyltransferase (adenine-specific)/site-specific DNA-methyltransferase (cytosine-N4-specific)
MINNEIICGDCKEIVKNYPDNCFDLIITSPPYARQRNSTYGGIDEQEYVEWFLKRSQEFYRVLSLKGSFILNIKENCRGGVRSTYVLELILSLIRQGWLWTEEFIWHKKTPVPGKWPNRFRDAWERLLQFNKEKNFNMYQESVMIPAKQDSNKSCIRLMEKNKNNGRVYRKTGSGFGFLYSKMKVGNLRYPDNVLYLSAETQNRKHPAVFPESLPEWFIKLFTKQNDIVLDPFGGSGTTGVVAKRLGRNYILIDKEEKYCKVAKERLNKINQMKIWY